MAEQKVWRRPRQAPRAELRLAVQVHGTARVLEATTLDLSRSGVRIKFKLVDLGLKPDAGLFDVAKSVNATLGETCIAVIRRPKSGDALSKHVRLVRLGTMRRTVNEIDLGCRFQSPLTNADLAVLGLSATARGESVAPASSKRAS